MSDFADILANLSPEQQELFRLRLARLHQQSAPAATTIPRQPRTGAAFPLSFGQQRLWFLDQLLPGQLGYVIPIAVRLRGQLDHAALERSLSALVERHETLRTTFTLDDERQPAQVIAPAQPQPAGRVLPQLDLSDWPQAEREAEAQRRVTAEIQRPFDLQTGPLIRALLLRLQPEEHWLVLTMHHIVSDGWSMGVLIRELGARYQRFAAPSAATPSPADTPPPIQYADYAIWQRAQLAPGARLDELLGYWRAQLAELPTLELPTDRPRPPVQTFRGAAEPVALPADLSAALQALSQQAGVTLFMTLLAAFAALLGRLSGQRDIAIGSPIAGRTQVETEAVIGFFVNMLVLRVDLGDNPSVRALLERVRVVCLDAYKHQELPFEMVVDALQARRDLSRNPLFQASFALQNTPLEPLSLPTLSIASLEIERSAVQFDLALNLVETAAGLRGRLEYNTDLFEPTTIARVLRHFVTLLEVLVAAPERRVAELPVLSAADLEQLRAWGRAERRFAEPLFMPALFAAQVAAAPSAIALRADERALSYQALDQQANQLARLLRQRGVGAETPVAVALDRSVELVVALLAVLKAGGIYVPLDPQLPLARLAFMLRDSAAPIVISHRALAERLPPLEGEPLWLDDPALLAEQPADALAPIGGPDHAAYLLYTSGSTGQPKGVINTHAGLANLLLWSRETCAITPDDRLLQIAALGFDISLWELLLPLISGATLVLPAPGRHSEPRTLAATAAAQAVTLVHCVPSLLALLLDPLAETGSPALRLALSGGEALSADLAQRWRQRLPHARLTQLYGPTEAAIFVSHWAAPPDFAAPRLPLGRPVANTQLHVLDAHAQPQPIGVAGEIHIGGVQLARGYHGRPALTAERFVPDPFAQQPGARLYRTGDLGRWRADGQLEFLGRIDEQIKLRGFRIELGEIEAVLRQHPAVRESVVVLRGSGERRYLAAYVVEEPRTGDRWANHEPAGGADRSRFSALGSPALLRDYLAERLPAAMLPSAFVVLPALPLTANGKIDRAALPDLDDQRAASAAPSVAPRTAIEATLATIWAEVLGLEQIGVHENFFDLRGHSLLAVQVISRIKEIFPLDVALALIFEAPTIAELAAQIERRGAAAQIDVARIAQLFIELSQLSDDQVSAMLAEQRDE